MPVVVTQAVPFKIDVVEPKVPLVRGGAMDLKVVATRQGDFKAPIAIRMLYNPPGVGSSGSIVIPEGQNEATIPLTATGDAEILKWKIAVLGEATVGDGPVVVSSQLAALDVAEPFLAFAFQAAAVEQGKATDLVIGVEKKKDFPGAAKVELLGVPNEVTAEPREITQDATQLVFQVKTTDKSPPGPAQDRDLPRRDHDATASRSPTRLVPANCGSMRRFRRRPTLRPRPPCRLRRPRPRRPKSD